MSTIRMSTWLCILFFSSVSMAQIYTGPAAAGAGGAGRASVDPGEVTFLNPAAVEHVTRYNVGLHYGTEADPKAYDTKSMALVLADGNPQNMFPGAFTYVRRSFSRGSQTGMLQDFAVTLAGMPVDHFSIGLTGHRLMSSISNRDDTQNNANLGLIYAPYDWLGFGFVVHELLNVPDDVPAGVRLVRNYGVGGNLIFTNWFRARLDISSPEQQAGGRRNDVMAGLESFFVRDWVFRVGSEWQESADRNYVSVGLGYHGPRLSFDYSFQKDVRSAEVARHLVDLWLPL